MPPNLLNPVLFTVLGDPITLAKALSSLGLALDVLGVVVLLTHDLRSRRAEADATDCPAPPTPELIGATLDWISRGKPTPLYDPAPHSRALAVLQRTRASFQLILAGFVLQLAGTVIS